MHNKPLPPGWPRFSSAAYYDDPRSAIDWLQRAFGFELRLLVENDDGGVEHSELTFGGAVLMVGQAGKRPSFGSPREFGGKNTQGIMVYVDDVQAHYERAKAAGATIVAEPAIHDYGEDYWSDRGYWCIDPGGHHWWFQERLRSPQPKADG